MLALSEELELVASYLRIERQRLGDRLRVDWSLDPAAGTVEIPALTLQPLVENAVYHGVERCAGGGRIAIGTRQAGEAVEVSITNPVAAGTDSAGGHRMAQENVRQRLRLAHGEEGAMEAGYEGGEYVVRIRIPAGPVRRPA
jgi:two-component system sensor histidine kinase AlgZ